MIMYLINFCEDCTCRTLHWFRDTLTAFLYLNSSINFLCYALRSSNFRNGYAKLPRIDRRRNRQSCLENAPAQVEADPAGLTSN